MNDGLRTGNGPLFLASVTSAEEARTALECGASIIDCKDPQKGALGALDGSTIEAVVRAVAGKVLVSATIGDLPSDAALMVKAAMATAAAGADIVKVGFFDMAGADAAIAALGNASLGKARLVAVLMADRSPDFAVISEVARAGFAGVMLDTADKSAGALPDILDAKILAEFVAQARAQNLAVGLAGSLRIAHIAELVALQPDIIGFRGALCAGGRTNALDAGRARFVRAVLDGAISQSSAIQRSVA